jgi:hypothetical protein
MLSLDDVLKTDPKVISRESEDELVVVQPDKGKFVVLNATGAKVVELADGVRTLGEIAAEIAETFGVAQDRVEADVLTFAASLKERGILRTP